MFDEYEEVKKLDKNDHAKTTKFAVVINGVIKAVGIAGVSYILLRVKDWLSGKGNQDK
mgnify:CR=1 FL=1